MAQEGCDTAERQQPVRRRPAVSRLVMAVMWWCDDVTIWASRRWRTRWPSASVSAFRPAFLLVACSACALATNLHSRRLPLNCKHSPTVWDGPSLQPRLSKQCRRRAPPRGVCLQLKGRRAHNGKASHLTGIFLEEALHEPKHNLIYISSKSSRHEHFHAAMRGNANCSQQYEQCYFKSLRNRSIVTDSKNS